MNWRVACALATVCACGGANRAPSTERPERAVTLPSATTPVASSSASPVPTSSSTRRVVFGPDATGPVSTTPAPLAAPVGPRGIVQLVATTGQLCVLRASGEIACIEDNAKWKTVPGIRDATYLATTHDLSCAVRRGGAVTCWGYVNESWGFHRTPTDIPHVAAATRVRVALASACALGRDGRVGCVGMGTGLGRPLERSFDPVEPIGLGDSVDLFGGSFETCARGAAGTVWCWGVAEHGTFGPFEETKTGAIELAGLRGATDLVFTQSYACAVLVDGGVACWGDEQPGANDDDPRGPYGFQRIFGIQDAVSIAPSTGSMCVLRRTGQVVCWGFDHDGQLGDGTDRRRFGPTDDTVVPIVPEDVASGNANGAPPPRRLIKRVKTGPRSTRLVNVIGLNDAVAIANDGDATCALRKTGALACWGTHLPGTKIDVSSVARPIPSPP